MLDMLYGGPQKEGTPAHLEDSKPSWQVLPSGDTAPVAGAVATSLAYREGVIPGALGFLVYAACTV